MEKLIGDNALIAEHTQAHRGQWWMAPITSNPAEPKDKLSVNSLLISNIAEK